LDIVSRPATSGRRDSVLSRALSPAHRSDTDLHEKRIALGMVDAHAFTDHIVSLLVGDGHSIAAGRYLEMVASP
jgi:hypothetical protein